METSTTTKTKVKKRIKIYTEQTVCKCSNPQCKRLNTITLSNNDDEFCKYCNTQLK